MAQEFTPPTYYPVFLDLRGKHCLVVGGGTIARRKVEGLLEAGAVVTVVAPETGEMPNGVTIFTRRFMSSDLNNVMLAIAATNDPAVNATVAEEAELRGVLVNVVDDPEHCNFILPATVRRGGLCIAVSTAGASPALARRIRERLEAEFGEEYGAWIALLWRLRREWDPAAKAAEVPEAARKAAWEQILDLPLLDDLRAGHEAAAEAAARAILNKTLQDAG